MRLTVGKKALRIKIDNLDDDNVFDVANKVTKAAKEVAPTCNIAILGASPETFEGSSNKEIKGK